MKALTSASRLGESHRRPSFRSRSEPGRWPAEPGTRIKRRSSPLLFHDGFSAFCVWQISLLISIELLSIPSPTTLLPFRRTRFNTLPVSITVATVAPPAKSFLAELHETHRGDDCVRSKVRAMLGHSPTGLAESSSPYGYGLLIHLGLLSTFPHGNAVTTIGFRAVTLPWTGLAPCSNAFAGALAKLVKTFATVQPQNQDLTNH